MMTAVRNGKGSQPVVLNECTFKFGIQCVTMLNPIWLMVQLSHTGLEVRVKITRWKKVRTSYSITLSKHRSSFSKVIFFISSSLWGNFPHTGTFLTNKLYSSESKDNSCTLLHCAFGRQVFHTSGTGMMLLGYYLWTWGLMIDQCKRCSAFSCLGLDSYFFGDLTVLELDLLLHLLYILTPGAYP